MGFSLVSLGLVVLLALIKMFQSMPVHCKILPKVLTGVYES